MILSQIYQPVCRAKRWLTALPDKLSTPCPLCLMSSVGGHLCDGCEADFFRQRQERSTCDRCASDKIKTESCKRCLPNGAIDAMACALDYAFAGQLLMTRYKQLGQLALARLFARLMVKAAQPMLQRHHPIAWVPIPASRQRLLQTGFSPAQQLARLVAQQTDIPYHLDCLSQHDPLTPQKRLGRTARQRAVDGRFFAHELPVGCTVGIVDDVVTTGSTVDAAARALKEAGASQVVVIIAARTPFGA